jgi:hypothetical protein
VVLLLLEESPLNSLVNQLVLQQVNNGAVTIKIMRRTNITSTNGVTLISLIGSFDERFNLNAI